MRRCDVQNKVYTRHRRTARQAYRIGVQAVRRKRLKVKIRRKPDKSFDYRFRPVDVKRKLSAEIKQKVFLYCLPLFGKSKNIFCLNS